MVVSMVNYTDVYSSATYSLGARDYMETTTTAEKAAEHQVAIGDVLITPSSETADDIGHAAVVECHLPSTVYSYHLLRFRASEKLIPAFSKYLFNADICRRQLSYAAKGTTRKILNREDFANLLLPLPSVDLQSRLAEFLDDQTARIDALIAGKEQLLERLAELRFSTVSWAVSGGLHNARGVMRTDNLYVPELPTGWTLGGLTKYIGPVVDYRGKTPEKVSDGIVLVTAKNIRDGELDYETSSEFVRAEDYEGIMRRGMPALGDVLFTTEAPLGQVANVDRVDIALAQRVVKFRGLPGILDNQFLKYWLMGDAAQSTLRTLATGSTAEGIKASKLGQIPVAIPPMSEQLEVVRYLDSRRRAIDAAKAHVSEHLERLREYRSSLISAAVTGQIDLGGERSWSEQRLRA